MPDRQPTTRATLSATTAAISGRISGSRRPAAEPLAQHVHIDAKLAEEPLDALVLNAYAQQILQPEALALLHPRTSPGLSQKRLKHSVRQRPAWGTAAGTTSDTRVD